MAGILLPACSIVFSLLLLVVYYWKKRVDLIENNIAGGKKIGEILNRLLETVITDQAKNNYQELIDAAKKLK